MQVLSNHSLAQFPGPTAKRRGIFERSSSKGIQPAAVFGSTLLQKFGPVKSSFESTPKQIFATICEATDKRFSHK